MFRQLPKLAGLGAVLVLALVAGTAILRAPAAAKADPESCQVQGLQDIYNDYPTNGTVGIGMQILCTNGAASIVGSACIEQFIPLNQGWNKDACWPDPGPKVSLGKQTIVGYMKCYKSTATWTYRGWASWDVTFPDGVKEAYHNIYTGVRNIGCSPSLGG